jgi:hypothetical protein
MKRSVVALIVIAVAAPAAAQSHNSSGAVVTHNQAAAAGAAGVAAHMQSLGYSGIHDLRRGPDGLWTGKATQNGVEKTVTAAPDGTLIGR